MFYLLGGGGQNVGPFENRRAVERFIRMMALCGEDWTGYKIVDGGEDDPSGQNPPRHGFRANPISCVDRLKLVGRKPAIGHGIANKAVESRSSRPDR